jgi:PucR C-terminal helix-turn-helix domain
MERRRAAILGVSRQTVTNRLRAIEQRLGRPLGTCANELEVSLQLEGLDNVKRGLPGTFRMERDRLVPG